MSVSGRLINLKAASWLNVGDVILNACRRLWPARDCCFQDALADEIVSLNDPWVWRKGTSSKEFFVYRDRAAAASWDDGPTRKNRNTMIHFIVSDQPDAQTHTMEVAVIFDTLNAETKRLVRDLQTSFELQILEAA